MALVVTGWVKEVWDKVGVPLMPDLRGGNDRNYDIHFHFDQDILLPTNDAHLSGAFYLSILSALSGWVMEEKVC